MNTIRTMGIFPFQQKDRLIDLFGYATKGVPGVDIIGLGKNGRVMREKFIFLSRSLQLHLPVKRFILCAEENPLLKEAEAEEIKWLELPLLILFWTLAERLEFSKLEDCVSSGQVSVSGTITSKLPTTLYPTNASDGPLDPEGLKLISNDFPPQLECMYHWLPLPEIMETIPGLTYPKQKLDRGA